MVTIKYLIFLMRIFLISQMNEMLIVTICLCMNCMLYVCMHFNKPYAFSSRVYEGNMISLGYEEFEYKKKR